MRISKRVVLAWLALLAAILVPVSQAHAQQVAPGPHPEYLHALSDLRLARAYLDQVTDPNVKGDANHAIGEIDKAINEIKQASIDDGKNLHDHPPIDSEISPKGRFHKALDLLRSAHADCAHAEDIPQARGLRDRALGHIDNARDTVNNAIIRLRW
jgi:tetratricopeptide (TPR) repeat protein